MQAAFAAQICTTRDEVIIKRDVYVECSTEQETDFHEGLICLVRRFDLLPVMAMVIPKSRTCQSCSAYFERSTVR